MSEWWEAGYWRDQLKPVGGVKAKPKRLILTDGRAWLRMTEQWDSGKPYVPIFVASPPTGKQLRYLLDRADRLGFGSCHMVAMTNWRAPYRAFRRRSRAGITHRRVLELVREAMYPKFLSETPTKLMCARSVYDYMTPEIRRAVDNWVARAGIEVIS